MNDFERLKTLAYAWENMNNIPELPFPLEDYRVKSLRNSLEYKIKKLMKIFIKDNTGHLRQIEHHLILSNFLQFIE